jgi:hypothetical protein
MHEALTNKIKAAAWLLRVACKPQYMSLMHKCILCVKHPTYIYDTTFFYG